MAFEISGHENDHRYIRVIKARPRWLAASLV